MSPSTLLDGPDAGGLHTAPLLGDATSVMAAYDLGWLELVKQNIVWALTAVVYSALAAVAFTVLLFHRTDRVYFWMTSSFLIMALGGAETALSAWTQLLTVPAEQWVCNAFIISALKFVWFMMLRDWFRVERPRWLPWSVAALALVEAIAYAGQYSLLYPLAPAQWVPAFGLVNEGLHFVFLLILAWITFRYALGRGVESWLLVFALICTFSDWLAARLTFLHVPRSYYPFGIHLSLNLIAGFLMAFSMCALLVRRWVLSEREQRVVAQELKQAQEVQQVLIPEAIPTIPGFAIESAYQPAGQVGGDFFQILPAKDGGALVCIGDVSGKGMPAAMTVSLLVGTLRTLAHYTEGPGEILRAMNQRMLGRSQGGFTTCLVLRCSPDGTVTVANAGHIPPYMNGSELKIESGLPLGLMAQSTYPETTLHQQVDEQITLMTDGVVEARSASGELFGFERTASIAHLPVETVVRAARDFGQEDDITVLSLTRLGHGATAQVLHVAGDLSPSVA